MDERPHAARAGSKRREYALLAGELRALDADIAAARAAAARASAPLSARRNDDRPGPAAYGERVTLPDGAKILMRPVQPEDGQHLEIGFERLSAVSRYRRFRAHLDRLDPGELDELTHLDHRTHEAIGALDPATGEGVGVARYACDRTDPSTAEITYVVADAWQHRGVATRLVERLARRARAAGIQRLRATTIAGDAAARRVLEHVAEPEAERRDGGLVEITARLRDEG